MQTSKLKPCPFCGNSCAYIDEDFAPWCIECGATIDGYFKTKQEAIDAWNRRQGYADKDTAD